MEVVNTFTGDAETEAEREAYFANVAGSLRLRGQKLGLKIGMETDSNMLPTAAIGIAILDRIDRPGRLGFNYDPGNVVYYTGADPIEDIKIALPAHGPFPFQGQGRRQGRLQLSASGRRRTGHAKDAGHVRRGRIQPARSAPRSSSTKMAGRTTTPASTPPNAQSPTSTQWASLGKGEMARRRAGEQSGLIEWT